jgi:hypothetical protein
MADERTFEEEAITAPFILKIQNYVWKLVLGKISDFYEVITLQTAK